MRDELPPRCWNNDSDPLVLLRDDKVECKRSHGRTAEGTLPSVKPFLTHLDGHQRRHRH